LDEAYKAVGGWRLEQILAELTANAVNADEFTKRRLLDLAARC